MGESKRNPIHSQSPMQSCRPAQLTVARTIVCVTVPMRSLESHLRHRCKRVRPCSSIALLLALGACHSQNAPPGLAIAHVSVVDVVRGAIDSDRTVVISGARILRLGPAGRVRVPAETRVIDGRGKYLIPGLWDMHVHLDSGALAQLVSHGVTGVRDMGGEARKLVALRRGIEAGTITGPRLVIAGPLLAGGAIEPTRSRVVVRTEPEAQRAVDSLVALGVDFIKIHDGLSRSAYFAIAREARARHVPFSGHVPSDVTPTEASDSGQKSIEHLEFIPDACMQRFSSPTVEAPAGCGADRMDALLGELRRNGTWLDPTISMFRVYVTRAAYDSIFAGFKLLTPALRRSGVRLLIGTDMENSRIKAGESLHDEMELLVLAGFSPLDVLRGTTSNAAAYLGTSDSLGTVAVGQIAELVLIDGDPLVDIRNARRISAVLRQGRVVFTASSPSRSRVQAAARRAPPVCPCGSLGPPTCADDCAWFTRDRSDTLSQEAQGAPPDLRSRRGRD